MMGGKYLPHLSLYVTAIERRIVVLRTIPLNLVSKGVRCLALQQKWPVIKSE